MPLAVVSADTLLGVAALLASFCGIILTIVSVRSGRKDATAKAEAECFEKLMKLQREAETISSELYQFRIQQYGGYGHERIASEK